MQIMTLQQMQAPLVGLFNHSLSCHGVWNSKEARFEQCFLPIISLLPGIVAVVVLLIRVLQPLCKKHFMWLRPFVVEYDEHAETLKSESKKRFSAYSITLLLLSIAGFTFDLVILLQVQFTFTIILPAISWVYPSTLCERFC